MIIRFFLLSRLIVKTFMQKIEIILVNSIRVGFFCYDIPDFSH